jgi:hypothetical protein
MFQMLRGTKTVIYLSDLMKRVGAIDAAFQVNERGETVIVFTLHDRRTKKQVLRKSAQLIDDRNQERNQDEHQ